jgi:hypothetical protein
MKKDSDVTLRKAENLSYNRLMGLNPEMMDDFFKISGQTTEGMKPPQRSQLIYNLDETGLQMTCSSGNQKLLAAKGTKSSHCYSRKTEKTVTVVA